MSETFQNIAAFIVLALSVIFLTVVMIKMFSHTGPDERNESTRYRQNEDDF